jgi:hypothetical protein
MQSYGDDSSQSAANHFPSRTLYNIVKDVSNLNFISPFASQIWRRMSEWTYLRTGCSWGYLDLRMWEWTYLRTGCSWGYLDLRMWEWTYLRTGCSWGYLDLRMWEWTYLRTGCSWGYLDLRRRKRQEDGEHCKMKECHNKYSWPNVNKVIKSRRKIWMEYIALTRE